MSGWISANYQETEGRTRRNNFARKIRRFFKQIRTWQLFLIAIILLIFAIFLLRINNLGMLERRSALIEADKTGEIKEVRKSALKLQNYVANHMNTATGKIALQTLYNDAAQAALNAAKPPEISEGLYMAAGENCLPKLHASGYQAWSDCVAKTVGITDTSALAATAAPPDPSAYYLEFSSARWSLDAAGITLFCALFFFAIAIFRGVGFLIVRILIQGKKS